jgi:hypothetical protein
MPEFCQVCVAVCLQFITALSRYAWNLVCNEENLNKINPIWVKKAAFDGERLPSIKHALKYFKYNTVFQKAMKVRPFVAIPGFGDRPFSIPFQWQ